MLSLNTDINQVTLNAYYDSFKNEIGNYALFDIDIANFLK